jgi:putative oxidoreductase
MNIFRPAGPRWTGALLSVLRIVTAFCFMWHGMQKLFGYPPMMGPTGTPAPRMALAPFSQLWVAGVLEVFGGALLLLGLFTRPVAFLLSGEMAVAYFQVHAPRGFLPLVNRGEVVVLFCFIYLYLAAAGGGPWSLDAMLERRKG